MRIIRKFKFIEDEDYGHLGFLPSWIEGANSFQRVAHDMIEHFLVPQCSAAEAELMALGAMLVIRIDGNGSLHMSAESNLAAVVEGAMTDWATDDLDHPRPLVSQQLRGYDWADAVIQLAVPKAFAGHHQACRSDSCEVDYAVPHALQPTCVSWLRAGVRRAYRRYAGLCMYRLGQHTMPMLDAFSERLTGSEQLTEGDEVVIHADLHNERFWATVRGRKVDV